MNPRTLTDDDMLEVSEWFADRAWTLPPVPAGAKTYGFLVEDLACAHLYLTNTGYAYIDWTATNPKASQEDATEAMAKVLRFAEEACRHIRDPEVGCLVLYTKSEALAQLMKHEGYRAKSGFIQCTKLLEKQE